MSPSRQMARCSPRGLMIIQCASGRLNQHACYGPQLLVLIIPYAAWPGVLMALCWSRVLGTAEVLFASGMLRAGNSFTRLANLRMRTPGLALWGSVQTGDGSDRK